MSCISVMMWPQRGLRRLCLSLNQSVCPVDYFEPKHGLWGCVMWLMHDVSKINFWRHFYGTLASRVLPLCTGFTLMSSKSLWHLHYSWHHHVKAKPDELAHCLSSRECISTQVSLHRQCASLNSISSLWNDPLFNVKKWNSPINIPRDLFEKNQNLVFKKKVR